MQRPETLAVRLQTFAVPAWAAEGLRMEDSLELKVRALLAKRRQAKGYIRELQAAGLACQ